MVQTKRLAALLLTLLALLPVPAAWAESGFAEAIVHRSLPVWGFQFHPERMSFQHRRTDTVDGAPLLCRFVALCRH